MAKKKKKRKLKGEYWVSWRLIVALKKLFENWNTRKFGQDIKKRRVYRQPSSTIKKSFHIQKLFTQKNLDDIKLILDKVPKKWYKIKEGGGWVKTHKFGKTLHLKQDLWTAGQSDVKVKITFYYLVKR